jgi:hypothetical protein
MPRNVLCSGVRQGRSRSASPGLAKGAQVLPFPCLSEAAVRFRRYRSFEQVITSERSGPVVFSQHQSQRTAQPVPWLGYLSREEARATIAAARAAVQAGCAMPRQSSIVESVVQGQQQAGPAGLLRTSQQRQRVQRRGLRSFCHTCRPLADLAGRQVECQGCLPSEHGGQLSYATFCASTRRN